MEAWFVEEGPLACVCHDDHVAVVFIHAILNHHETPVSVLRLIATHELLHLIVPPRTVSGISRAHPPEFFEQESALVADRQAAWAWMRYVLGEYLRVDRKHEGVFVKRNWRNARRQLNGHGVSVPEEAWREITELI